jgi:hypothetical protein
MASVSIDCDRVNGRPETGWYYYPCPPRGSTGPIADKDKSPRAATYDEIIERAKAAGYEIENGGWKQKLLMWNWNNVSLDGYPGWAIEHGSPPWCRIEHVNGDTWEGGKRASDRPATKSSSDVANAWDNVAEVQFYTRDLSYDGSVSVMNREPYGSLWWFRTTAERDRFLAWLPAFDSKIKVIYRNAAELPPQERA